MCTPEEEEEAGFNRKRCVWKYGVYADVPMEALREKERVL